jgi:hypothetical protein
MARLHTWHFLGETISQDSWRVSLRPGAAERYDPLIDLWRNLLDIGEHGAIRSRPAGIKCATGWRFDPDLTGLELFERLQRESPGIYPDGQLRTLQRRLKHWRMSMARSLVFGVHASTAKKEVVPPSASSRTSFDDGPINDEKRRHIVLKAGNIYVRRPR